MRIVSWNINGIRSICKKGFADWLAQERPDVLGLQETRADEAQSRATLALPRGYRGFFSSAERKGYSGTAILSRRRPRHYRTELGHPAFDAEGRIQHFDLGDFVLFNVYFPNGSGVNRDNSRVPFKLAFYRHLLDQIEALRRDGREVVVMGDYNTAHREIDLKNWRQNRGTSGFLDEERAELDRWLQTGLVDTFRHLHGDVEGAYSWWSVRQGVRERNIGWRIDYVLVTPGLLPRLKKAFILPEVLGSDHCPVGIDLK
jgi:exodeoxyribonuclease-3